MMRNELERGTSIPKLLTLSSVAEVLAISPHTVRKMVRDGRLRPIKICRRLLFTPDSIKCFLAAAETLPPEKLQ
jgi:excisionase family DNA binding protein